MRIYQLDAIRGLLAIGVVVYHVFHWAPEALGTWGVYGFFVLSGFAMEHVYGGRFALRRFVVARITRLAPLWIPVVLVSAALYGIADPPRLLLNLTGAFGFVSPGATSIVTGGWSIGIEVVCYAMFCILAPLRLSTPLLGLLAGAGVALRLVTVGVMPADLVGSWVAYTVPSSFLGFFLVGMLGARLIRFSQWTGWRARVSTWLGDASYGTYLLHPLVAIAVGPWALLVTPPLAWLIYRLYEVPMRQLRQPERHQLRHVVVGGVAAKKPRLHELDHRDGRLLESVVEVEIAARVLGDGDLERIGAR